MRIGLLILAATILGCRSTPMPGTPPAGLSPGPWRLLDVGGAAAVPEDAARRPWLSFATDSNRVSGHFGCNGTGGQYTAEGQSLKFERMMRTKMACADQRLNVQESAVATAVESTDRYRIAGDTLELRQGERILARFVRGR